MRANDVRTLAAWCFIRGIKTIAAVHIQCRSWVISGQTDRSAHGRPSGAFGVYEIHRGNWAFWALGSDHAAVALIMLGKLVDNVIRHIRANGGHRIECKARMDRTAMHQRLRLLGFRPEGKLHRFGTDRADYAQYSFLIEDEASEPTPPPNIRLVETVQAAPAA